MIQINFRDSSPFYEQIKENYIRLIVSGALAAHEKLPSVRELAAQLSINPNTIQRAYRELEQEGYTKLTMTGAEASSQIYQAGVDNSPYVLYDGQDWSSWQEGDLESEGLGENITLTFDGEHAVRFIKVRLGNWYGEDNYYYEANNRPETITFELGEESFSITFPDERKEHIVELSKDVTASQLKLTIDSVYKGSIYDDTCINEVTIYGK